jgi:hypothetical protein
LVSGEDRQPKNAEQGGRDVPKVLPFSNDWDKKEAADEKTSDQLAIAL